MYLSAIIGVAAGSQISKTAIMFKKPIAILEGSIGMKESMRPIISTPFADANLGEIANTPSNGRENRTIELILILGFG